MKIATLLRSSLVRTGSLLIGIATGLYGLLGWSSSVEQARSPGEKNLGVAVLGMLFGIPAVVLGILGLGFVVAGICVWVHRS